MKHYHIFLCLLFAWVVAACALFFYSFTQVDLALTLTSVSIWQSIQRAFQSIGYFYRPISTGIYIGILFLFYGLYGVTAYIASQKKLTTSHLWRIIGSMVVILLLSYPAFSYDMFNYMFTAKTVLVYHKNPYDVIALQFVGIEPWLSFMRWTHLPSAYTPLWILLTLPAYMLGFGYFLVVLWNIKLLVAISYVIAIWYMEKILRIVDPDHAALGMVVFALNPLVIIETLVSSHNDMVMMAIVLVALYYFLIKKPWQSFFFLAASVAMKLMTIFLVPIFFLQGIIRKYRADLRIEQHRFILLLAMLFGFFLVTLQREVLPWYWVWIMPFVALVPRKGWVIVISTGISLGLLLRYAPFLYYGHWDPPVPMMKSWVTFIPIVLSISIVFMQKLFARHTH